MRFRGHARSNGGVHGDIEFNSDVFELSSIEQLAAQFEALASSFADAAPEEDVWQLSLRKGLAKQGQLRQELLKAGVHGGA